MFNKDRDPREDLIFSIGIGIVVVMVLVVLNIFTYTAKAATVSGNDSSVSGDTVAPEQVVVSSNYTSSNTLSGSMTYDQGDRIIHVLYLILFVILFSFCYERIRNGIRSLNKTR